MKIQFYKTTSIIALTILHFSCGQQNNQEDTSFQEFGKLPAALADSLRMLSDNIQNIEIDPTIDNTIVGRQGTTVIIPANSLIDEQGKSIAAKTKIQLKECYSILDIVNSHLQTVHNEDILQTKGMIYLKASTTDGKNVKIDKLKPIRIEMPVISNSPNVKFFKGKRDENGNMNWITVEDPSKKLIPLPIKLIAPRQDFECRPDFGFTQDPDIWRDTTSKYFYTNEDITQYENSLIATREFKARYYSYCMSDLTKIYLANLDKNMWEVDELMVRYFIKDSILRVNLELNDIPPGPKGGKRTTEQIKAHQRLVDHAKESGHEMIETFKMFASQKLTKVDENLKIDTTKVKDFNQAFVAYETVEFGWINCDVFFNDPRAERIKLFVQTNEPPAIINIVFKEKRIILDGIEDGNNGFRFVGNKDGYNKLPKGDKAIILAIGYRDNKITFDSKEIVIGENEIEKLNLQVITSAELKKRLANFGD